MDNGRLIDEDRPSRIVVLVHGTWGRGLLPFRQAQVADWCKPSSAMCQMLVQHLGSGTRIDAFNWSGANSPDARVHAAKKLEERLRQLQIEHPTAHLYVLAHSHGGNIVHYAVRNLVRPLQSVVYLSTPFLHVAKRSLGPGFSFLVLPMCFFMSSAVYGYLFTKYFLNVIKIPLLDRLVPLFVLFLSVVSCWGLFLANDVMSRASTRYVEDLDLNIKGCKSPTLIVRATADEAASALSAAQFFSTLLTRLVRRVFLLSPSVDPNASVRMLRPLWLFYPFFFINGLVSGLSLYLLLRPTSDWLERLFGVFWPICAVELWRVRGYRRTMFFGALMMLFILIPYTMSSGTILEYVRAYISWHDLEYLWLLMLLPVFFMVPLACAIVGLGALAGLMLLPFGIRFATAGVSLQLSAEVTPPGNWEVLQLPCAKITLEGEARLRHETHSDPRAIAAIGEWLSAQL